MQKLGQRTKLMIEEEISEEANSLVRVPFSHHSEGVLEVYLDFRITHVQFKTLPHYSP